MFLLFTIADSLKLNFNIFIAQHSNAIKNIMFRAGDFVGSLIKTTSRNQQIGVITSNDSSGRIATGLLN